jgi:acyl-CoA synthetase (AMP-forming)/AMP-acid ligase II
MTTVRELIEQQAALRPGAAYAIAVDSGRVMTYADLVSSCRAVTAMLAARGSRPGDHVSLVMPNGLGTLAMLLGTLHGGRCVNPVNLLAQPEQMRYVLEHADAGVVLVSPDWEERVRDLLTSIDRTVEVVVVDPHLGDLSLDGENLSSHIVAGSAEAGVDSPPPDALGLLMYTSGTTGRPKGVMLTQSNLAASARAITVEHELTERDRVLAVLPLYHINAFAVTMLAPLAHGGSLAVPQRFSATAFWDQATSHGCTWINLVPTMISYLLEGETPERDRLRHIRSAGRPRPRCRRNIIAPSSRNSASASSRRWA